MSYFIILVTDHFFIWELMGSKPASASSKIKAALSSFPLLVRDLTFRSNVHFIF